MITFNLQEILQEIESIIEKTTPCVEPNVPNDEFLQVVEVINSSSSLTGNSFLEEFPEVHKSLTKNPYGTINFLKKTKVLSTFSVSHEFTINNDNFNEKKGFLRGVII